MEFTIVHKENTTFTATIKFNMPVTTKSGGDLTKDQLIFNFDNETVLPTSDDITHNGRMDFGGIMLKQKITIKP